MLARLTELVLRSRKAVLATAAVLAILGAAASGTLFGKLDSGGWDDPQSGSGQAAALMARDFRQGAPNFTLLVTTPSGVDAAAASAAGTALTRRLAAEPGVVGVTSYWTAGHNRLLRSKDGKKALILATITGGSNAADKRFTQLLPGYQGEHGGLRVQAGGYVAFQNELNVQAQKDAEKGESAALPITLIALVLVFGGIVTAMLPLIVGVVTMLFCLGLLWLLASVTSLSSLSVSMVTLLGLGLAIDYSLLTVSRFREELRNGQQPDDAIRGTMRSAGRTVAFSALMVTVATSGMVWFPLQAVRSLAYAGMATAPIAALTSLTVLPALLATWGSRVAHRRSFLRRRSAAADDAEPATNGFWHRLATFVMGRPVPVAAAVTLVLLLLGVPALGLKLGMPDERVLPASAAPRQVAESIRADFGTSQEDAIQVVAPHAPTDPGVIGRYAGTLSRLPDVAYVSTVTGTYTAGQLTGPGAPGYQLGGQGHALYLSVVPASAGTSQAESLTRAIRTTPGAFLTFVGGVPALNTDAKAAVQHALPFALAWVVIIMLALLYVITGSVLLPFLALVLSALSLTATFGALVWIFQDGHLSGLLGFTATGQLAVTVPVLLFALSFGLAMDYQVFLLSRIREEYQRCGDPTAAVASGLERIGRIVTAAAVLISIVFLAFLVSGISLNKAFGIGLPLAVLLDATLVRGALLPAAMRLGGRLTWWSPRRPAARPAPVPAQAAPRPEAGSSPTAHLPRS